MKIDKDKLTAYALGELSGADAKEVEAAIAKDPALRRIVDETRAFGQLAERDLRAEPLPGGRGSAPVLAEIARRSQERAPQARRAWLQAGALGALIVLLMLALPLRKQFQGNVANILGTTHTETAETTDDEHFTHRAGKVSSAKLTQELADLRDRTRVSHAIDGCRFAAPSPKPETGDSEQTEKDAYTGIYLLAESDLGISILVRSTQNPSRAHDAEEVSRSASARLYRLAVNEASVIYYVVPEKLGQPYCIVQVGTDWAVADTLKKPLASGLDDLARSIADGLVLRER